MRSIGVSRAVPVLAPYGATRRWLKRFILTKAVYFAVMASAIGVIIGIVFVITLDFLGPFFLRASPVSTNKALSTFPLLTTFLLVITATLLAAVRPARKAAMTSPIEAISRVPPSGRKIIKIYQIALSLVFTTIGILALGRFGSNPEASWAVFLGVG